MRTLRVYLWRFRWPLVIFLAALGIRLAYNHWIHPPQDFIYSDMGGYMNRATRLLEQPFGQFVDEAFYPVGTHYLLAGIMALFGKGNHVACATGWALMGALLAPIAYLMGGRLHGGPTWARQAHSIAPPTLAPNAADDAPERSTFERYTMACSVAQIGGLLVAVYYPLISYTGYFLSEIPFALFMSAAALFGLRLADAGRTRDALGLGVTAALGAMVRPQLLIAVAMALAFLVWRRNAFPAVRLRAVAIILLPIVAVIGASLALSEHHTGRATVLAQNGALNRAFGRCHNYEMRAHRSMFGPPAFGALHRRQQLEPDAWFTLAPAITPTLRVNGPMWDEDLLNDLADRCVERSGLLRQGYYALSHVVLLWGYNVAWPDMGLKPFRYHMRGWTRAHFIVFVFPCLIAMAMGASRRWPRHGLLTMYLWAMLLTVAMVMGSARLRAPYDLISIVLGLDIYARLAGRAHDWWQRRRRLAC